MDMSEKMYSDFVNNLTDTDMHGHSCMNDLVRLKDYREICMSKIDSEDDVHDRYMGEHRFYIMADKMKRYLLAHTEEYFAINKWELFVRLTTGEKFVYDELYHTVRFIKYEDDNLTDAQERKEFARNLRKIMGHKFTTQEELADKVGVSRVMINKYMNGKALPNAIILNKLAKALKCSVNDFYYKHF